MLEARAVFRVGARQKAGQRGRLLGRRVEQAACFVGPLHFAAERPAPGADTAAGGGQSQRLLTPFEPHLLGAARDGKAAQIAPQQQQAERGEEQHGTAPGDGAAGIGVGGGAALTQQCLLLADHLVGLPVHGGHGLVRQPAADALESGGEPLAVIDIERCHLDLDPGACGAGQCLETHLLAGVVGYQFADAAQRGLRALALVLDRLYVALVADQHQRALRALDIAHGLGNLVDALQHLVGVADQLRRPDVGIEPPPGAETDEA